MKHRLISPWPAKARKAWPYFSVLLLPALASAVGHSSINAVTDDDTVPLDSAEKTRPYLQYVGAPPLRFEESLPPSDLSVRPTAAAPPTTEHSLEAAVTKPATPQLPSALVPPAPVIATSQEPLPPQPASSADTASAASSSILPDETKPKVKPEDFLPFFQYPGGPSAPGTSGSAPIPPSSATYKLQ